jgi:hypothetical protein
VPTAVIHVGISPHAGGRCHGLPETSNSTAKPATTPLSIRPWTRPSLSRREVKDATLTGNTAVVTVSLAGAASSLASESEALTYSRGAWGFVPNDLSMYEHGSVRADLAAAKAAGYCAES